MFKQDIFDQLSTNTRDTRNTREAETRDDPAARLHFHAH